ncbi:MAG TPA: glucan biosynthesis protein G [Arenicellales bacterium]|nr:glucan biosynthesis protein G [Arenicellales bacterium]
MTILAMALLAGPQAVLSASAGESGDSLFPHVTERARSLAGESYSPPAQDAVPALLKELDYEQYRDIRFRKKQALWRDESPFNVEFFHLGFLYREPVVLHQVVDGNVEQVRYDNGMFDYGDNRQLEGALKSGLGFAGFRIHFPINRRDYHDEVIAFLGASYFRMVGSGQAYGLSARGLAIDTALPEGEEFPRFTEFWLVRPGPDAKSMTFYALLDGKSVTGAYRFVLTPGSDTTLDVEARLFARRDIKKLGVAPLTSMFLFGENSVRHFDDYRPEVHDSDGLLMQIGSGEWIWRPLTNGRNLQVSTLMDGNPRGFGLVQRDREFANYLDTESSYQRRPSHWITPLGGDWGKGAVQLIEIPSKEETNDNIGAFWVPEKQFKAGQERVFRYRISTFDSRHEEEKLAAAKRTRIGWGAIPGSKDKPPRSVRQFIVDFSGGKLDGLNASQPVEPDFSTSSGKVLDMTVTPLPRDHGWRVAFKLDPQDQEPADMRLFLKLRDQRLTETWNYVWNPRILE